MADEWELQVNKEMTEEREPLDFFIIRKGETFEGEYVAHEFRTKSGRHFYKFKVDGKENIQCLSSTAISLEQALAGIEDFPKKVRIVYDKTPTSKNAYYQVYLKKEE